MTAIPTKTEFQKSTDLTMVTSGKRAQDTVIQRVDALLDLFHGIEPGPGRVTTLALLYFTTDRWLKLASRGSSEVNNRRTPAVSAFYRLVVQRLTEETGWAVNLLPRWLEETFGKAMGQHGSDTDADDGGRIYMSAEERAKYELVFRNGLVYQRNWWASGNDLVLVHTPDRTPQVMKNREIDQYFAGYAASMSGTFFSGPHNCRDGGAVARYHSAYLAGDAVLCAGQLKIDQGRFVEINAKSGHYQPGQDNLAMAVEALASYGVNLDNLKVTAHGGLESTGRIYLTRNMAGEFRRTQTADTERNRFLVTSTREAHATRVNRAGYLDTLKSHWVNTGGMPPAAGHGVIKKDKCHVCKGMSFMWDEMKKRMIDAGGIEKVNTMVTPIGHFAQR